MNITPPAGPSINPNQQVQPTQSQPEASEGIRNFLGSVKPGHNSMSKPLSGHFSSLTSHPPENRPNLAPASK